MARLDPCPNCGAGGVRTINTRQHGALRYRRKACDACGSRWSTAEVPLDQGRSILAAASAVAEASAALARAGTALTDITSGMPGA